ncbi:MAG: ATP-dependent zinc metalloprotease FtsH [Planctomycetes bacterium]|nr:ATP-dependent zinc metalloprotease FtsH [Planctomycetota bacterium]
MSDQKNTQDTSKKRGQLFGKKPKLGSKKGRPFNYIFLIALVLLAMSLLNTGMSGSKITWTDFEDYVNANSVDSVKIGDLEIKGKFKEPQELSGGKETDRFRVSYRPELHGDGLRDMLRDHRVEFEYVERKLMLEFFMSYIFPLLLIVGVFYFLFARNMRGGAGGMLMSFGRSKHRMQGKDNNNKVTFNDVAGIEEAKDEVTEIIEFLKNPKRFQRLGGRIPRGVLLVGPPGCGKTLLAKAIAGEANVPFFSISGSDFVEMFVGVGASRVRDLFKQAKENAPCIIFLDEVDAIGRKRGGSFAGGGHDEREQTLNAILVEMDGFDTNDQVIVVAATNRGDILDHALTRPGRFDRQVVVPLPDLRGRLEILQVHAKKVKLDPEVAMERIARGTPMFSGADLEATINEAALAATLGNKDQVELEDLEEARDKVRWGRAKKSRVIDEQERIITAYHEAGHTVIQCLLEDADPLHKVSIIPRGPMGGATFALPEKDRTMYTRRYCMALMQVCYGGRVGEELFCDDISSGAQGDIEQATNIAKQMVSTWGMSDVLGLVSYSMESPLMESYGLPAEKEYSDKTAREIDQEIKALTGEAYKKARILLEEKRDNLHDVAQALLKYETLDADEVMTIIKGEQLDKPTVGDLLAAEQAKTPAKDTEGSKESERSESDDRSNQDDSEVA